MNKTQYDKERTAIEADWPVGSAMHGLLVADLDGRFAAANKAPEPAKPGAAVKPTFEEFVATAKVADYERQYRLQYGEPTEAELMSMTKAESDAYLTRAFPGALANGETREAADARREAEDQQARRDLAAEAEVWGADSPGISIERGQLRKQKAAFEANKVEFIARRFRELAEKYPDANIGDIAINADAEYGDAVRAFDTSIGAINASMGSTEQAKYDAPAADDAE